jgi:hypothetical protein
MADLHWEPMLLIRLRYRHRFGRRNIYAPPSPPLLGRAGSYRLTLSPKHRGLHVWPPPAAPLHMQPLSDEGLVPDKTDNLVWCKGL